MSRPSHNVSGLELLGFKKCTKCNKWLPRSYYHTDRTSSTFIYSKCKSCTSLKMKAYNKTEHAKQVRKVYKQSDQGKENDARYAHSERGRYLSAMRAREYRKQPMTAWKERLRRETKQLILQGLILHPGCCEECGVAADSATIHVHHLTYLRPDRVLFLCPQCHTAWHRENQAPPEPAQEWVEHWYETYNDYPEEGGLDGNLD